MCLIVLHTLDSRTLWVDFTYANISSFQDMLLLLTLNKVVVGLMNLIASCYLQFQPVFLQFFFKNRVKSKKNSKIVIFFLNTLKILTLW